MVLTGATSCGSTGMDSLPNTLLKVLQTCSLRFLWFWSTKLTHFLEYDLWENGCALCTNAVSPEEILVQFRTFWRVQKFTSIVYSDNMIDLNCEMPSILEINQGDFPTTHIDTASSVCHDIRLRLSCAVCSIEEKSKWSLKIKTTRHFSQKMKGMAYWNECHMASHVSVLTTSVSLLTGVEIFTWFEIMHIKDMEMFWNQWELNRNPMERVYKSHRFL